MIEIDSKVYSEVFEILNLLDTNVKLKIPYKIMEAITQKKDDSYSPKYDITKKLEEQNIMDNTIAILTILKLNYWSTKEEKEQLLDTLNENEKYYQKVLEKQYDVQNIFNVNKSNNEIDNNRKVAIVKYEENAVRRFIDKLKMWFNKK